MSKRSRFWLGLVSLLVLCAMVTPAFACTPPGGEVIVDCDEKTVTGNAWGGAMFRDIWVMFSDGTTYYEYFMEPVSGFVYEFDKCIVYVDAYAVHQSFDGGRLLIVAEDFNCGCKEPEPKRKTLSCPVCESPKWEEIPDGEVASLQYSRGECVVNIAKWCLEVDTWVRFVGHNQSFKIFYLGVTYTPEARVGADGHTWYSLDIDMVGYNHDYIWLNADAPDITSLIGFEDAWRLPRELLDYGNNEYVVCSMAPSYADTDEASVAYMRPGHVISDWAKFLLMEGYFEGEQYRGDAALAWANELSEAGSLALP